MAFRDDREALQAKVRAQEWEIARLRAELEARRAGAVEPTARKSEIEQAGDAFERAFSSPDAGSRRAQDEGAAARAQREQDAWAGTLVLCLVVFPAVLILLLAVGIWITR